MIYTSLISKNKSELENFFIGKGAFSRTRKLNLIHLIGHLLYMVLSRNLDGYEISSDNYFHELQVFLKRDLDGVTRSSICEARYKLHWKALEFLLKQSQLDTDQLSSQFKWKGHVVRAIDGSKITLPHSSEIIKTFPQRYSPQAGSYSHYPFAVLVCACNVITGQPTSARIYNMHGSEKDGLLSIMDEFRPSDITLIDRGLGGSEVWNKFEDSKQYYVNRVKAGEGCARYVKEFVNSNKKQSTIWVDVKSAETSRKKRIQVRLLRGRLLKDGSLFIVVTNLLNRKKYPRQEILQLYAKRWEAETLYGKMKSLLNISKFHSRKTNGIFQEIFANLLVLSLTSLSVLQVQLEKKMDPKEIVPNFKNATEVVKRYLYLFLSECLNPNQMKEHLKQMTHKIGRILCKKQKGRSYPRVSQQPVNPWPYAKRHKISIHQKGRRISPSKEMRKKYKKIDQRENSLAA